MALVLVFIVLMGTVAIWGNEPARGRDSYQRPGHPPDDIRLLTDTELVVAFAIFRHGDRTPDDEELAMYQQDLPPNVYFPYGKKALTNKGKQRAYSVGKYLRRIYDGFISRLYLPDEITVRTTSYARTQMTVLSALAAMYPPPPPQKWNPALDWQPIPYNTLPPAEDDLMFWANCPKYNQLYNQVDKLPEIKRGIEQNRGLFNYLSEKTGTNITRLGDVFRLDSLFQTLSNIGVDPPRWARDVMPKIKQMTKLEYVMYFYNDEMIAYYQMIHTRVLLDFILNKTDSAIDNGSVNPKLYIFSAHENNVAALIAAARVFMPHQPNYGATFSLQLRRKSTGEYGIMGIYAREAGGPDTILPVGGCGGELLCDYGKFVELTRHVVWSREQYLQQCIAV